MSAQSIPPSYADLNRRVTVLETRFDVVVPTLATKADLQVVRVELEALRGQFHGLRGDVLKALNDQFRWLMGFFLTLLFGLVALNYTMWSAFERNLERALRPVASMPAQSSAGTAPDTIPEANVGTLP